MPDDEEPRGAPFSSSAPARRVSVIVPPPDVAEAIRDAQDGPPESRDARAAVTQTICPTCDGTGLCLPEIAAECIRLRALSRPPEDPTR